MWIFVCCFIKLAKYSKEVHYVCILLGANKFFFHSFQHFFILGIIFNHAMGDPFLVSAKHVPPIVSFLKAPIDRCLFGCHNCVYWIFFFQRTDIPYIMM